MTVSVSKSIWKIVNGDAKNCQEPTAVQKRRQLVYTIAPFYAYSPGKLDKAIDITSESETGPVVLNILLLFPSLLTLIYPFVNPADRWNIM